MIQYYNPSLCLLVGAFDFYLTSSVVKVCGRTCLSYRCIGDTHTHYEFNSHASCCGILYGYQYGQRTPTQTPIMSGILNTCTVCMKGTETWLGYSVYNCRSWINQY